MNLKEKLSKSLQTIPDGYKIYLFGSLLNTEECNDIDLAIIYDNKIIGIEEAIEYRKMIINCIEKEFELPIEIILLSNEENKQTEFVSNIKTEIINACR